MMIGELINMLDAQINTTKADGVIEQIKVENYFRGKTDGLLEMRNQFVDAINKEFEEKQREEQAKEQPEDNKPEEVKPTTTKKK